MDRELMYNEISSRNSTSSSNQSINVETIEIHSGENTSCLEKGAAEEKDHTEKKINRKSFQPRKTQSTYWDEYDDLPANADDRKLWFLNEYKSLLSEINGQNCLIKEFKKTLLKEIKAKRNKKLVGQLKSLLRTESEKNDGLISKALRIQRKYPDHSWEPIPYPASATVSKASSIEIKSELFDCHDSNVLTEASVSSVARRTQCTVDSVNATDVNSTELLCLVQTRSLVNAETSNINNNNNNNNINNNNHPHDTELAKFHKELSCRHKMLECLEEKYQYLNEELQIIKKNQESQDSKKKINDDDDSQMNTPNSLVPRTSYTISSMSTQATFASSGDYQSKNSTNLQNTSSSSSTDKIKVSLQNNQIQPGIIATSHINGIRSKQHNSRDQSREDAALKQKYTELLLILKKKECELQKILDIMQNRFSFHLNNGNISNNNNNNNNNINNCNSNGGGVSENNPPGEPDKNSIAIIQSLQMRVSALQLEQKEFHKLIRNQQDQLEKYQKKYVKAQKRILGQKRALENIELNNRSIENDIKIVITKLKDNYEDKLKDYNKYPKLLKIEKSKVMAISEEKLELEERLNVLTKEYKIVREKLKEKHKKPLPSTTEKIKSIQRELKVFKNFNGSLKDERDRLKDELKKSKDELESFRTQTNKLLFRSKDRTETQRRTFQKKINELESELLQNRASATCFIRQRDKVIAEMQKQLSSLNDNFETSKNHIETLRKHIYSLSKNEEEIEAN